MIFRKNPISQTTQYYELRLPDGFGIIGRFPAPLCSFGFYISWMIPRSWSPQTHVWFPPKFRASIRSLLLSFYRLGEGRSTAKMPFAVLELIVQKLTLSQFSKPEFQVEDSSISIKEF